MAGLQYRFPFLKPALQRVSSQFRHRDAVMQTGIGRGLKFNTGGSIAGYALGNAEPDLQAALRLLAQPGMTVYDIGANVGFFSVLLARLVGPKGQVYAFEPVPANARQIEHNALLNGFTNIHVDMAAVGGKDGTAAFHVSDFSTTGKLCGSAANGHGANEIPVPTRQLDQLLFGSKLPRPSLIKIDTEGAEVEILRGAEKLLKTARPILLIEFHNTAGEVTEILERHGYSVHVLGSAQAPREAEWNSRCVAAPRELDGFAALIPALTDARRMG